MSRLKRIIRRIQQQLEKRSIVRKDYSALWEPISKRDDSKEYLLPKRSTEQYEIEGQKEAERLFSYYHPHSTVVEIGVGNGRILRYVAMRAKKSIGIDVSQTYIREARRRLLHDERIGMIEFIHTTGRSIPLPDSSVDFIYSINTFLHLQPRDIARYCLETYRVLRKGGAFYFIVPNREASYYTKSIQVGFVFSIDNNRIVRMIKKAGFSSYRIQKGRLVNYGDTLSEHEQPEFICVGWR